MVFLKCRYKPLLSLALSRGWLPIVLRVQFSFSAYWQGSSWPRTHLIASFHLCLASASLEAYVIPLSCLDPLFATSFSWNLASLCLHVSSLSMPHLTIAWLLTHLSSLAGLFLNSIASLPNDLGISTPLASFTGMGKGYTGVNERVMSK